MGTQLPPKKGAQPPPIFGPCLLWQNGWMDQDATWYGGRPRPKQHCVRWGPSSPPQKGQSPPPFSAHVYCGQTDAWIKKPHGTEVGLGPHDIVLDVDPAPTPKKSQKWGGAPSPILAHVYCGQTAGCFKMALGWTRALLQTTLC